MNQYFIFQVKKPYFWMDSNSEISHHISKGLTLPTSFTESNHVNKNMPEEIQSIVHQCWVFDPEDRMEISEVFQQLKQISL